jgi:hypothetical protein
MAESEVLTSAQQARGRGRVGGLAPDPESSRTRPDQARISDRLRGRQQQELSGGLSERRKPTSKALLDAF